MPAPNACPGGAPPSLAPESLAAAPCASESLEAAYRLSFAAIAGLQLLLLVSGYRTSVPPGLHLNNKVLLSLYTAYIAISLACLVALVFQRRAGEA